MPFTLASHRWLTTLLFAGTLMVAGCARRLAPDGHYQDTPVVADGSTDDWPLPLRFSNESYTLQYNVTNDNKNLYVCVLSRDPGMQLRILRSGMTIYFDPKGDKSKDIGLHFPLLKPADPEGNRIRYGNGGASDSKARKEEYLLQSDSYGTTGFSGIENGQFGVADPKGPFQVVMKLNNQDSLLVYEVVVPIKNVLGVELAQPSKKKKNFSVGIVLNAVANSPGGRSNGGPRPSFGGGGGGMHMSMGGMRGGGSRRNYNTSGNGPASKEEADWYTFRLVTKK